MEAKWKELKIQLAMWMKRYPLTYKLYMVQWILRHEGAYALWRKLKMRLVMWMKKYPLTYKLYMVQWTLRHGGVHALWDERENIVTPPSDKDSYLPYDAEYQDNFDFSNYHSDVKLLAYYLPQFHSFPENDKWWGKGFTEWTNTKKCTPRFEGHYQPRVPHKDIGYYCLDDINVLRKQAELAKQHGIYGFCFYYYWFSGKRLMEKPLDMFLEHPEVALPFCLCWANENWTRRWDGLDQEILMKQGYTDGDDEKFIIDMQKYIEDPRYIRINGRPLIVVYNARQIPDCHKSFQKWRETARQIGIGDIMIWICRTWGETAKSLGIDDCVDGEAGFTPHNMEDIGSCLASGVKLEEGTASIYNYQKAVDKMLIKLAEREENASVHHCCTLGWDNAPRRKQGCGIYYAFSLHSLYRWVLAISERTRKDFPPEERFAFINAWNEWAEGAYLEPDEKYGYANINTVSKALLGLPFKNNLTVIDRRDSAINKDEFDQLKGSRIAIQIHVFYLDVFKDIIEKLNAFPYSFDCYISTDTKKKKKEIKAMMDTCNCKTVKIQVFPNRGRDVAPMLQQLGPVINKYDYICHVHTKKSIGYECGDDWRNYLFNHLLGNSEYLKRLFCLFEEDKELGLVFPETFPALQEEWYGNYEGTKNFLKQIGYSDPLPNQPTFPAGNMFWARTAAVQKIFSLDLSSNAFPEENKQIDITLAHYIERSWVYAAASTGYSYKKVFNNCSINSECSSKRRLGIFAHYDEMGKISKEDLSTIKDFSGFLSDLLFVTNAYVSNEELEKIKPYVSGIKIRENVGYDFGAWRDYLLELGEKEISQYDQLVLLNNSCLSPVFDIREMFSVMEAKHLDFWGNTVYPYSQDGDSVKYLCLDAIPEHLQSYFLVFEKPALTSDKFWQFWKKVDNYRDIKEVIANCEITLTKQLADAGFSYEPYISESSYLTQYLNDDHVFYTKPLLFLLLRSPFIKKKCINKYLSKDEVIELEWMITRLKKEDADRRSEKSCKN